jgi:2-phosphosulfolactate phosphatase
LTAIGDYFDQSAYRVRCEWGLQAIESLGPLADAIVIVDVLSFSTCADIAVGRGAFVLSYPWKDESVSAYAAEHCALVAGPRGGDGFSLSPKSLMDLKTGDRIVLPSPNGSALSFAARDLGKTVITACLRNAEAVARALADFESVLVVPAGERWPDGSLRPCVEDWVGAGAIISYLSGSVSPEADLASVAFEVFGSRLRDCVSGRELIKRGFEDDVEFACELNASEEVPRLTNKMFCG